MLRIKELREAKGLSQQRLAELSGLSIRTVVYAEDGRDIKASSLVAFARALGVSVAELFQEGTAA